MTETAPETRCPCGTGLTIAECCGPILAGERRAPTAESLMRSRYTAFAVGDGAHLLDTWHPDTRPTDLAVDPDIRWYRLDIEATVGGGLFDTRGEVVFTAYHRTPTGRGRQREHSRFERLDGAWMYVDGIAR